MGYEKYTLNVENILNTYCKKYDYEFSNGAYDKEDFIENSNNSPTLFLGMECYDNDNSWTCRINKNLLCLTDEEINKIAEYDKKKKGEDYKRKLKAEKARQEKQKKKLKK